MLISISNAIHTTDLVRVEIILELDYPPQMEIILVLLTWHVSALLFVSHISFWTLPRLSGHRSLKNFFLKKISYTCRGRGASVD